VLVLVFRLVVNLVLKWTSEQDIKLEETDNRYKKLTVHENGNWIRFSSSSSSSCLPQLMPWKRSTHVPSIFFGSFLQGLFATTSHFHLTPSFQSLYWQHISTRTSCLVDRVYTCIMSSLLGLLFHLLLQQQHTHRTPSLGESVPSFNLHLLWFSLYVPFSYWYSLEVPFEGSCLSKCLN